MRVGVARARHVTDTAAQRSLQLAAVAFVVVVLLHNSDHVRRGADTLTLDVFVAGSAAIVLEVAVVVLIYQRHRFAALAAFSAGVGLALGYLVVHFLPERSWLSDSLAEEGTGVTALSWIAASLEVAGALALAFAGWAVIRSRGGLTAATAARSHELALRATLLHPLVVVFALGQFVILALSLAQR